MNRRAQVLALLSDVGRALDDDDICGRLAINRHRLNTICPTPSAPSPLSANTRSAVSPSTTRVPSACLALVTFAGGTDGSVPTFGIGLVDARLTMLDSRETQLPIN